MVGRLREPSESLQLSGLGGSQLFPLGGYQGAAGASHSGAPESKSRVGNNKMVLTNEGLILRISSSLGITGSTKSLGICSPSCSHVCVWIRRLSFYLLHNAKTLLQIVEETAEKECICDRPGRWQECAKELCHSNGIGIAEHASTSSLYEAWEKGSESPYRRWGEQAWTNSSAADLAMDQPEDADE